MFTSNFMRRVLFPLAIVLTPISVLTAFQSPGNGVSPSSPPAASRILSDAAHPVRESGKNLSDSSRCLTDTKRILADSSQSNANIFRSVRDARRKLKDQSSVRSGAQLKVSDETSRSDLRFIPNTPINAEARISKVQSATPSIEGPVVLTDEPNSLNMYDTMSASGIPSEITSKPFEVHSTAYNGPQERVLSDSMVEKRNQTIRKFLNLDDSKRKLSDSPPAFVNPEAFRVTPETVPSPSQVQRKFHNASTNKSGRINLAQEYVEEELAPLDQTNDSVEESYNSGSATRSLSDSDDIISNPDTFQPNSVVDTPPLQVAGNIQTEIGYDDPMSRAFSSHTIGDPYIGSRSIAPEYRFDATQKVKTWRSPNLKHRPLYFEDAALERHGQSLPKAQPILSGARFFGSALLLPQKVLTTPPRECVYPVGHGRPGNCTPKVRESLPRRDR